MKQIQKMIAMSGTRIFLTEPERIRAVTNGERNGRPINRIDH